MAGVRRLEDLLSISGVQIVQRVDSILPQGDRGYQRPVVPLAGADARKRTIGLATRSGASGQGCFPAHRKILWRPLLDA